MKPKKPINYFMAFIGFLSFFRPLTTHSGLSLAGNFYLLSFQRIYKVLLTEATASYILKGQLVTDQNRLTSPPPSKNPKHSVLHL